MRLPKIESVDLRGLPAVVYRAAGMPDCTAGGVTASADRVLVVGSAGYPMHGGIYDYRAETRDPVLVLVPGPVGQIVAVPLQFITEGVIGAAGPMFGGNFIYSSDSRFSIAANHLPVPVFDRAERGANYGGD